MEGLSGTYFMYIRVCTTIYCIWVQERSLVWVGVCGSPWECVCLKKLAVYVYLLLP